MAIRLAIFSKVEDPKAVKRKKELAELGFGKKIKNVFLADVYTIDKDLSPTQFQTVASKLSNPLTQTYLTRTEKTKVAPPGTFTYIIEIGFLPGVTDNVGNTAKEIIEDALKIKFADNESVYTSQATFIQGDISEKEIAQASLTLYNPLIQRVHIKSYRQFKKDGGMDVTVPKVSLIHKPKVAEVDLNVEDNELIDIGKRGIKNSDGTARGPLALDLIFMKTIQKYYREMYQQVF